jgi:hypothetical protein
MPRMTATVNDRGEPVHYAPIMHRGRVTRPSDGSRYSLVCAFESFPAQKVHRYSEPPWLTAVRSTGPLVYSTAKAQSTAPKAGKLVFACLVFSGATELGRGGIDPVVSSGRLYALGAFTLVISRRRDNAEQPTRGRVP